MNHLSSFDIYLRFFVAFGLVIVLIGIAAWMARFLGFSIPLKFRSPKNRRLNICDVMVIDAKRRLILVSRDDVEHLICVGGTSDFIVESHIKSSIPNIHQDLLNQIHDTQNEEKASHEA